ncbi:MAG TPA: ATP-dependent DNA helicase [Microbacterium sp.]|uniref:ATP-dependent helicase n=1 Tax=Microbacterium sp. TaxID=51671 RepID=UPI002BD0082F|nr:ATP-dependent DNA helicase [Microbacterium sp.]HWI32131.1 ATP-dependent DNA helicase [Microbacterium sp.]
MTLGGDSRARRRALDDAQRAIVQLPAAASAVVVGAPGTGKTSALIARVEHLLSGALDPSELLVLTPSRQSATDLRDVLALASGEATPGSLARSVASFAFHIVRASEVHAGAEPPQLLTGADEDQIVQDLLEGDERDAAEGRDRWPEWLGPAIRGSKAFRSEVRAFMAECAALGIEPPALARLGAAADRVVWVAMASFMTDFLRVRAAMRGAHRDPAGLVREAAGILRTAAGGAASLGAFARLRVVLVDDAQELTLGGVQLLEACRARGIAVVAFGDPDVGSGAFRGAAPEHFARLAEILGTSHVLSSAHRGTAAQAHLVRRVTQRIGAAGVIAHRTPPAAHVDDDASVRAVVARSASEEYDAIARLLRERHVHDGVAWDECAVIAHDTRQGAALEAELSAREVPARASGPGRALGTRAPVRDILHLVTLATRDPSTWTSVDVDAALTGAFGGLDPVSLRRLRTTLRHAEVAEGGERAARELLRSALANPLEFALVDTREARRGGRVAEAIVRVRDQSAHGASAHDMLWTVWEGSGLARAWGAAARGTGPLAEQANRDLDALVALFQSAKRFVEREPGEEAMVFVRRLLDSDVADDTLTAPPPRSTVRVLTPAAALGAEFDTVVVAGVQEGVWPNVRLRGGLLETWRLADALAGPDTVPPDVLDRRRSVMHDELRLFVRAVSRARERVIVTAVDDDDTGPSVLFEFLPEPDRGGRGKEHPLSLRGLVAQHRRALTDPLASSSARREAPAQLALLADAGVAGAHPREWYGVTPATTDAPLRDIREEGVRVSPSRLHALEECELNWVIADLGGDTRGGPVAGLGVILHSAMEVAEGIDEASLWSVVEARWGELEFDAAWRERQSLTRARDLVRRLHAYLRDFEASGGTLIGAEPHFEIPIPFDSDAAGVEGPGILVSGYIDRVELTGAGDVVIVDLKTGKSEPQTDAKVAENPQLAAYQLAFESGLITGTGGHPGGGAKLLVLVPSSSKAQYVTPTQPPFDDEHRDAFLARVRSAATTMAGVSFTAPYEDHCRKDHSYGLCRIHTVRAVSAS